MFWTERPAESHFENVNDDEYGNPRYSQTSYGPFYGADLSKASFKGAHFRNADFRDAVNIDEANFIGAYGLEDCRFDSDDVKERVLAKAATGRLRGRRRRRPRTDQFLYTAQSDSHAA